MGCKFEFEAGHNACVFGQGALCLSFYENKGYIMFINFGVCIFRVGVGSSETIRIKK